MFNAFSQDDERATQRFKSGEMEVDPGTQLFVEGAQAAQVYTVLSGLGLRYKTLPDGRRQVVNFVMPGDFIGLQAGVMGEMHHAVESTTKMTLCVFNRHDLWSLFQSNPERAFDLTFLAAVEEHLLGEALSRLGQHSARTRVAWCLHRIHARAEATGECAGDGSCSFPYRQQDLADALGLSLVHTNKTLAALREDGLASWISGRLHVPDPAKLAEIGMVDQPGVVRPRPLI